MATAPKGTHSERFEAPLEGLETRGTQPEDSGDQHPILDSHGDSGVEKKAVGCEGMSKRQWKKLVRMQKLEDMKPEWRKKKREMAKERRRKRKLEGIPTVVPCKKKRMGDAEASSISVAIDFGFEHLMKDKDIKMLVKQCQRCYAANRRADIPLQLYLTSFGGRCKERVEAAVQGYQKWDVHFRSESYIDEFDKDDVVFLAAESPNVLQDLDPAKVYVIGGLVDHNHYKGYCYQTALENGVSHAQLPLSEYIKLNSRKVLAVSHVFEILLKYVQHKSWKKAISDVIPQRKVVTRQKKRKKEKTVFETSTRTTQSVDVLSSTSGADGGQNNDCATSERQGEEPAGTSDQGNDCATSERQGEEPAGTSDQCNSESECTSNSSLLLSDSSSREPSGKDE